MKAIKSLLAIVTPLVVVLSVAYGEHLLDQSHPLPTLEENIDKDVQALLNEIEQDIKNNK